MASPDERSPDIDKRIADAFDSISELRKQCRTIAACRQAEDVLRLARREQLLIPILQAQFEIVNLAQSNNQSRRGREVAVEMIALLESPDRARQIQADFAENEYADTRAWMSSCAYDNLATHTAELNGYNSEGMHQCIADGIEVCRRTGKLRCITCFREYASDVHFAADDLEMALHFARLGLAATPDRSDDRRWVSAKNASWMYLIAGDFEAAEQFCRQSLVLAESYHTPFGARIQSRGLLAQILAMTGRLDEFEKAIGEPIGFRALAEGENPSIDCKCDRRDAVTASCRGEYDKAIDLVRKWEQIHAREGSLSAWFGDCVDLINLYRLAGKTEPVDALAGRVLQRAKKARDWLTVRRLQRAVDPTEKPTPIATLQAPRVGPFAATVSAAVPAAPTVLAPAEPVPAAPDAPSPLQHAYEAILARCRTEGFEQEKPAILRDILAMSPESFVDARDASSFLYLLPFLRNDAVPAEAMWTWAEATAARFLRTATVANLLATLGDALCAMPDSKMAERIAPGRIESLFRQSLDLDPDHAGNHARAGGYFLAHDNLGEAERCLARGFRLARHDSYLASRLAEIYQRTDRSRDALAVLDLCLREGSQDANVAWEAAMIAYRVASYEPLLAYIDRFEKLAPNQIWAHHFRAVALLETGRPTEALESLAIEDQRGPGRPFGIEALRACAASALGQPDACREHIAKALALRWSSIDYFTNVGIQALAHRLWKASDCLPAADALVARLRKRLIEVGFAPDHLIDKPRLASESPAVRVNHFRCVLRQPLDERWPDHSGCLPGQQAWREYRCLWGVLALDADAAQDMVLAIQTEAYELPATVVQIEDLGETYEDKPGVLWQGQRWVEAPAP
jgi:tetratricopeptide (TPR) repeat protein